MRIGWRVLRVRSLEISTERAIGSEANLIALAEQLMMLVKHRNGSRITSGSSSKQIHRTSRWDSKATNRNRNLFLTRPKEHRRQSNLRRIRSSLSRLNIVRTIVVGCAVLIASKDNLCHFSLKAKRAIQISVANIADRTGCSGCPFQSQRLRYTLGGSGNNSTSGGRMF